MTSSAARRSHKRVAIVYYLDRPGGVQSVVLSLVKGLNARGIVPDFLWDRPPSQKMLDSKGVRANYQYLPLLVPTRFLENVPSTIRYLFQVLNRVHENRLNHTYDFYFIFYNGFLVSKDTPHLRYLSGPPLLPQLETSSPGLRGVPFRFFRWAYKTFLCRWFPIYEYHRGSNYVINSQFTAQMFEEAHGVRLPIVHPPIVLSGRSFHNDDLSNRDTITYFSRFVDYKRPEMLLTLAEQYPQQRFVLMGGIHPVNRAYFENLKAQANARRLANVTFLANPSNDQVEHELARTLIYVFPAANEHFGMTTAEAIGSGAIPFVHDSGGQREIVPDERLRFNDGNFLAQFNQLFIQPPATLNDIRRQMRKHIDRYSEENFINHMLELMDQQLESEWKNALQVAAA